MTNETTKMVAITLEEYENLIAECTELECLHEIGVDNWSGYGEYESITGKSVHEVVKTNIQERSKNVIEITQCKVCRGTGNMVAWNRAEQKHTLNEDYPCQICKGAKFVVISNWERK